MKIKKVRVIDAIAIKCMNTSRYSIKVRFRGKFPWVKYSTYLRTNGDVLYVSTKTKANAIIKKLKTCERLQELDTSNDIV